jgi:dihydroneopterin aldolase
VSETPSGDAILLEGIQVPAALGVTAAERAMRRGRTDRIRDTIHYAEIYDVACDVASHQEHKLVEALGERIAHAVLSKFDVDWITVTVRKVKPISGVLDTCGVRMTRRRAGA